MLFASIRPIVSACVLATAVMTGPAFSEAQPAAPQRPATATTPAMPAPPAPALPFEQRYAPETRDRLREVLSQYPPTLQRVLQLDPSLLRDEGYLASYPALQAYLIAHPEVAHNPAYFLGEAEWQERITDPGLQAIRTWERVAESVTMFLVFLTIVFALGWLVRTMMDYRRWQRVSKVQAEAHAKLLDRLTSNDELLTYVQSSAGRKFLESAPIPLDGGPRPLGAPFGRILWSVQAGLVLAFAGLGLRVASGSVSEHSAAPLAVLGVLALMLGAGFAASAGVAFLLSRRLGLLESAPRIGGTGGPGTDPPA
jgi:hypothetical protein